MEVVRLPRWATPDNKKRAKVDVGDDVAASRHLVAAQRNDWKFVTDDEQRLSIN